ncbi:hypothetical protein WJX72_007673 [[Myrmecia] bisecta]|uniref:Uncharacterized protein n=1 Tax=[Myrmecia] bisecta TaxID=41462 RepID=A0AAW1P523_9CHLO
MSTSAVVDPANLPATVAQLRAKIEGAAGLRLVYEDARRDMNIPPARKGASSVQELLAEVQARVEGLNVPQWEGRSWQAGMRGGDRVDILDPRSEDKLGSATVLYGLTCLNSVRDPMRTVLRVEEVCRPAELRGYSFLLQPEDQHACLNFAVGTPFLGNYRPAQAAAGGGQPVGSGSPQSVLDAARAASLEEAAAAGASGSPEEEEVEEEDEEEEEVAKQLFT